MKHLAIFFLIYNCCFAQYQCKTKVTADSSFTKCYHKNGKVASLESWDAQKRNGRFFAFNSSGAKLISYYLRGFAGHASVYVTYHGNGQVAKVEYSSAPDAGIQFYRIETRYNELGEKISEIDMSYPPESPSFFKPNEKEHTPLVQYQAPVFVTKFFLNNTTKKSVSVKYSLNKTSRYINLGPKQSLFLDSISDKYKFTDDSKLPILEIENVKFKLVQEKPQLADKSKIINWYVIKP